MEKKHHELLNAVDEYMSECNSEAIDSSTDDLTVFLNMYF